MTTFDVIAGMYQGGRQAYLRKQRDRVTRRASIAAGRVTDAAKPLIARVTASFLPLVGVGFGVGAAFHFGTWIGLLAVGLGCQLAHRLINGD